MVKMTREMTMRTISTMMIVVDGNGHGSYVVADGTRRDSKRMLGSDAAKDDDTAGCCFFVLMPMRRKITTSWFLMDAHVCDIL